MMFDVNGGPENVFAFLEWFLSFMFFVIGPTGLSMFLMIKPWYRKYYSVIVFIFGFAVWFTMFYVRYPSLTFWKVL